MPKLEYIDFIHNLSGMVVLHCRTFDFTSLTKTFPGMVIRERRKGEYELTYDALPDASFSNAFIQYLGTQGWDAYSATDTSIFLKRSL
jgi:hypothetical protein